MKTNLKHYVAAKIVVVDVDRLDVLTASSDVTESDIDWRKEE